MNINRIKWSHMHAGSCGCAAIVENSLTWIKPAPYESEDCSHLCKCSIATYFRQHDTFRRIQLISTINRVWLTFHLFYCAKLSLHAHKVPTIKPTQLLATAKTIYTTLFYFQLLIRVHLFTLEYFKIVFALRRNYSLSWDRGVLILYN